MDYPKSVPTFGLVDGRFVDENPIAGTPESSILLMGKQLVTRKSFWPLCPECRNDAIRGC